ncbi:NAD(P)/FAD-dependent oxidoreductase [uncultured Thiohalocapsa sp.]|uniref:NAD(P)/FAD-dependent oxidoreductase n=1 Tax=uncultured Thiohalocapsa sp. TaxID=768990 RepID=UPI0025FEB2C3|nr:NAD(P)/FAD-dependent oxidoreductase [uncultured Thiohalocapsa sp.]
MSQETAVIIGAGPAGLTAAYELVTRTNIRPIVIEASGFAGGIARTINYKGNRIDIGGHRFFSKSDRVMNWWTRILPIQGVGRAVAGQTEISYQNKRRHLDLAASGPDPELCDDVMLLRPRVSRILYGGQFFDYPIKPSTKTLAALGWVKSFKLAASYAKGKLRPVRPERSLQDFLTNRFGYELYATFFRDYTEKVWGVPCHAIPAEWGAQRIKGLSVSAVVTHALRSIVRRGGDVAQKGTETSLIEQFLYPKFGPGQLWEKVAALVEARGGKVHYHTRVTCLRQKAAAIVSADVEGPDGARRTLQGEHFLSSMPVRDLVAGLAPEAPPNVREVALELPYRDFITVGLLLRRLRLGGGVSGLELREKVPDNWIYVQEPQVKVGRLQIFNNWSPYMVADPETVWIGLEYFVNEGDYLWSLCDDDMFRFGVSELVTIGVIDADAVLDHIVIRMPKTYPAYFGSYDRFGEIRDYLGQFRNLFPLGRNGMHRYNNQDHSMLTAMTAVDGIIAGIDVRGKLWDVNADRDYHEERKSG